MVHAVLHRLAPQVRVIDLSHQLAPFDVAGGAAMLVRCAPHLGAGVVLAVVDPGVGTEPPSRWPSGRGMTEAGSADRRGGWWGRTTDC